MGLGRSGRNPDFPAVKQAIVFGIISKEGISLLIPLALPIPSFERLPQVKLAVR